MKISKRDREQAALICAIAASAPAGVQPFYDQIADNIDAAGESERLAMRAWKFAWEFAANHGKWTREVDAEAEALIRTGWSP